MNNKALLTIILILLIGIAGIFLMGTATHHDDGMSGTMQEMADEIRDEIDDHS